MCFTKALMALAVVAGGVLALTGEATADTAPPSGTPPTVSPDGLPMWQINGVVWHQAVAGGTVFAGGQFTKARPRA